MSTGRFVVVDASLASAAFRGSPRVVEAAAIVDANAGRLAAPSVLWQEFANGVFRLERRAITQPAETDRALSWLNGLLIRYLDDSSWAPRAVEIARQHRQSRIFDAIFYVCAEDLGAEMWTCDRKFVTTFGSERPAWLKLCPDDA